MPNYLPEHEARCVQSLDEFTQAYVYCALWASRGHGETEADDLETLDDYTADDLDPATLAAMVADCEKFKAENAADLSPENCLKYGPDFGPMGRAGHDFFLTRCHHGAGFWDGDWAEPAGTRLTEAAQRYGDWYFWVENGVIFGERC